MYSLKKSHKFYFNYNSLKFRYTNLYISDNIPVSFPPVTGWPNVIDCIINPKEQSKKKKKGKQVTPFTRT